MKNLLDVQEGKILRRLAPQNDTYRIGIDKLLEHHLKLGDQIVPVTQEANAVILPIQVVILQRQSERIARKCYARLDQPGSLPVVEIDELRFDHPGPEGC